MRLATFTQAINKTRPTAPSSSQRFLIRLNGEPYTVVGVAAAGMPDRFESHLFVPLSLKPDQINRDNRWLPLIGRLKPGVTLQRANADMESVAQRIAETYPLSNKGWSATVEPLQNDFTSPKTRVADRGCGYVLRIAVATIDGS